MSDKHYWYGYLQAGHKSSAVLRDERLADHDNLYLYNLERDAIVEYKRAIIEPKLRPLTEEEQTLKKALKAGYAKAYKGFTPRHKQIEATPLRGGKARAAANDTPYNERFSDLRDDDTILDDYWPESEEA